MSSFSALPYWERVDVSHWQIIAPEQSGTHETTWIANPSGRGEETANWLHKNTTVNEHFEQGEDWAEVIASRVGAELGVPLAETRLCLRDGRRGSLSRDVRQAQYDLVSGHLALEDCRSVTDYFPHFEREPAVDPNRPDVRRPGHSLSNIRRALADCEPPPEFSGPVEMDAFDVFAGYLLFDALVANRDRHEENWSVLRPRLRDRSPLLCPSYDHSSSLGFAETPEKLRRRSEGAALRSWAEKGTAWRFEHMKKPLSLVALAGDALRISSPAARVHWTERLDAMQLTPVTDPIEQGLIPEMSEPTITFVIALLTLNLERTRHELGQRL